jgi:GNAT superfamily N-acetyltransferase
VEEGSQDVSLRHLLSGEEELASELVMRSYRAARTTDDSPAGVEEFTRYAAPGSITGRMSAGSIVIVAFLGAAAIGVVEIRAPGHIGLLFISADHQGRGVGRRLCEAAIEAFARRYTRPSKVTVKASPGSVAFYEKLGFAVASALTEFNGIRFVPMERELGV